MKIRTPISVLRRAARRGDQRFPIGTVAFYGPDDRRASKVVLGIIRYEGAEPQLQKWTSDTVDLRQDTGVLKEIVNRMQEAGVKSVVIIKTQQIETLSSAFGETLARTHVEFRTFVENFVENSPDSIEFAPTFAMKCSENELLGQTLVSWWKTAIRPANNP